MARRITPEGFTSGDWERARPHLMAAADRAGTHNEFDLVQAIAAGKATLWLGEASAVLSEIIDYPKLRTHRLWLAGGDLEELLAMEQYMAAQARLIGCTRQDLDGRLGWQRVLKTRGYSSATVTMHRELAA
jgi:hypothetical protein